jgi:hypothetical protein
VIPIEDGGTHEMANLATICSDCFDILHGHGEPPALGSDSDSPSINSYTDLYETFQETLSLIVDESDVHLAGFTPENDLGLVVNVYEGDRGDTVDGLRKSKRKLGNVDPYDIENSDLPDAEVEDLSAEILRKWIMVLDSMLRTDRLLKKYVLEVAGVTCSECGEVHDGSSRFCGSCGNELELLWRCSECDENRPDADQNFCADCGSEFFVYPPDRREQIDLSLSVWESEARRVSDYVGEVKEMIAEMTSRFDELSEQ